MLDCSWKKTTGLECPGCGLQRSFDQLIHGNLTESLVLFPALLPFLFLVAYTFLHILNPRKFPARPIVVSAVLTGILMAGNWIYKIF